MFNPLYIKELLSKKKLIYKDVYAGSGVNESTFKGIMSKGGNPSANILEALADFLECSIDDFFDRKYKVEKNEEARIDDSLLYKLYKEKDAQFTAMSEELGKFKAENNILKERLENLTAEITLLRKLSSGSQAAGYAINADALRKEQETP